MVAGTGRLQEGQEGGRMIKNKIINGDCIEVLKTLPDGIVNIHCNFATILRTS